MKKKTKKKLISSLCSVLLLLGIYFFQDQLIEIIEPSTKGNFVSYGMSSVPEQEENLYKVLNNNQPTFTEEEKKLKSFESYSELDSLGRCGTAFALVSEQTMPKEERGKIGMIKPSGWHTVKYSFVDGKYLYNRCHLIAYQLTGENANEKNLITCTRTMNTKGMLPFENEVAKYVKETKNHVLYRVKPIFKDKNLLASGVEMEAYSIEDSGKGIFFHIYVYNKEPKVWIDYKTGESKEENE